MHVTESDRPTTPGTFTEQEATSDDVKSGVVVVGAVQLVVVVDGPVVERGNVTVPTLVRSQSRVAFTWCPRHDVQPLLHRLEDMRRQDLLRLGGQKGLLRHFRLDGRCRFEVVDDTAKKNSIISA